MELRWISSRTQLSKKPHYSCGVATNIGHRCGEWQVKQSIAIVWVDGIAEEAGWKGEGNNQPNHTTAREVEFLFEEKEGRGHTDDLILVLIHSQP